MPAKNKSPRRAPGGSLLENVLMWIVRHVVRVRDYLAVDFLGGPKWFRSSHVINFQKGATGLWVLWLMHHYDNWDSHTAWAYLGLHGSYGLCWLLKDAIFPDLSWQRKITFGGVFVSWAFVLGPYWVAPFLLIRDRTEQKPWVIGCCTLSYVIGLALMLGADCQKYFTLKHRKELITTGFFRYIRHPNYLGEMMLYGSFAYLSGHKVPWYILAYVWVLLFIPNMLQKEFRMKRHDGWAAYKARAGFLLPKIHRLYVR